MAAPVARDYRRLWLTGTEGGLGVRVYVGGESGKRLLQAVGDRGAGATWGRSARAGLEVAVVVGSSKQWRTCFVHSLGSCFGAWWRRVAARAEPNDTTTVTARVPASRAPRERLGVVSSRIRRTCIGPRRCAWGRRSCRRGGSGSKRWRRFQMRPFAIGARAAKLATAGTTRSPRASRISPCVLRVLRVPASLGHS